MAGEHSNHVLALDIRSRRMGHERTLPRRTGRMDGPEDGAGNVSYRQGCRVNHEVGTSHHPGTRGDVIANVVEPPLAGRLF